MDNNYFINVTKYKMLINKTPNKFLNFQLDFCIKNEWYELAQYIIDIAQDRNFSLSQSN